MAGTEDSWCVPSAGRHWREKTYRDMRTVGQIPLVPQFSPHLNVDTDGLVCQSKLTVLVHKYFGQALAPHQYREWVSPIISLVDFSNLHCVICQEVMDDAGMVITKGTVGVIPYGIEAKHLSKKKQTNMDQNHLLEHLGRSSEVLVLPGVLKCCATTHLGEGVAVDQAVGAAVHGEVNAQVQILPVVIIPVLILGHPVASHEFALEQTRVLHLGLDDAHAVIFQVVVEAHLADPVQSMRMRMRLLLPGNMGTAESVSFPGDDLGSSDDTSSVEGYQSSHQVIRLQTCTAKDSVLQATPGERFWKYQSFGGKGIRKMLLANETGDFKGYLVPWEQIAMFSNSGRIMGAPALL
ncbi:hypothetical protein DV515_00000601 [Chloebia gouldiae]|uniref:Uncharacterized protein n=1 Tax=Chloebia gouldiae TaxID=44316 RepID=A0A3L8T0I1_CHLGU|nr:hypothetical protein DV515_00000601 [Chloebia gouldiae]